MTVAHIINRPGHEVGDKALALCGAKHKVEVKWEDLPDDQPICRPCVDVALHGLSDITDQLAFAIRRAVLLVDALMADNDLTGIIEDQRAYNDEQEAKAIRKAEKKQAKKDRKAEVELMQSLEEKADARPPVAPDDDDEVDTFLRTKSEAEKWALLRDGARTAMQTENTNQKDD